MRPLAAEVAATRPDLSGPLAEAQALAQVLDAAGADEPDLVQRLVDERLGYGEAVRVAPEDETHAAEIHAALDSFEAEAEPPLAQFERLTGHTLAPATTQPSVPQKGDAPRLASDRSAEPGRRQRLVRTLAFAGLALAVVYSGLFLTSSLTIPERARVADVADVAATFRAVRGAEVADQYAAAVDILSSARHTTLGLFPRYDDARLDEAANAFAAIAHEGPEGQYGKEAALAIGRIRMLQGRDAEARIALAAVVAQGGYRAPEAVRLLDYLDARAAAPEAE